MKSLAKKTPATIAREEKIKKEVKNTTKQKKSTTKPLKDENVKYISSFNWWLEITTNENWAYVHNVFTPEECKKIIEVGTSGIGATPLTYGMIGGDDSGPEISAEQVYKTRRSPISWIRTDIPENRWIFERITSSIISTNKQFFNYDLTDIQSLQFTCYDGKEKGFYEKHIDMMYNSTGTRKLSLSIQLSDSSDYEGGDLLLHYKNNPDKAMRNQGTATFFPSWMLHEVTPVTKGKRYSLVAWVQGPRFK
jgi:PKHD-type hydroxylase